MTEKDIIRFSEAVEAAKDEEPINEGFTVYNEGLIHKAVKLYIDSDPTHHEVKLGHAVADVLSSGVVYEVQTGSPLPLLPKIKSLLPDYPVTLVLPYRARTRHLWLDPDSGEISAPKRIASPQKSIHTLSRSMAAVKELIGAPGFSIRPMALAVDELRLLDGYGKTRKIRATFISRTPCELLDDFVLTDIEDYRLLLPDSLGEEFTAPEFLSAIRSRSRYDRITLNLLSYLGCIERVGKRKNAYIYRRLF